MNEAIVNSRHPAENLPNCLDQRLAFISGQAPFHPCAPSETPERLGVGRQAVSLVTELDLVAMFDFAEEGISGGQVGIIAV